MTSNPDAESTRTARGGRRYPPYVFTEQGVAMLSSVLHSDRAIHVNIEIMRAFVRLRHDCMDAGGRAASGTAAESNAGSSCRE